MIGAKLTGLSAVGVAWGFGSVEELITAGAAVIVETVPELPDALTAVVARRGIDRRD